MPKRPRWTPQEAEEVLLKAGFTLIRTKGSHRIYMKANSRVVIPFHSGTVLHPKIIKQVLHAMKRET